MASAHDRDAEDGSDDEEDSARSASSEEWVDGDQEDEDLEPQEMPEQPSRFERISPISDTPWSEFFLCVANLALWPLAFIVMQLCWCMRMKQNVDMAFLPVSLILVPFAYLNLRGSRYVGHQHMEGLQFMLHWLFSRNWCLHRCIVGGEGEAAGGQPRRSFHGQMKALAKRPHIKPGLRYKAGLATCTCFFWVLAVGHACWPTGYLYLVNYSFRRCQFVCKELADDVVSPGSQLGLNGSTQEVQIFLAGNATRSRAELMGECQKAIGRDPTVTHLNWADPHWLIQPTGSWVIGHRIEGNLTYNVSKASTSAHMIDCKRFDMNSVVLVITGFMTLLVGGLTYLHTRNYAVFATVTVAISLLCSTGIVEVWMGWVNCRASSITSHHLVFRHLLDNCLLVGSFNGSDYSKAMQEHGRRAIAFESNFRHVHQVSRSEVWFGSLSEATLLALVIAAHSTFRHKRMQTREARFELMRRRPKLVRTLLEHIDFLDELPPRDRTMMAWTLSRVYKQSPPDRFKGLEDNYEKMMKKRPSPNDLAGVARSFWPAAIYSLVRALIPSTYRQFIPSTGEGSAYAAAVPEENTLWMLSALMRVIITFVVYLFVLFQIKEASRRYTRNMQVWLVFDSLWNFPSQCSLAGDALTEIIQVNLDEDGESLNMIDRSRGLIGDFSAEHVGCDHHEGATVNVDEVREKLTTWWAWREYLIIDYTDKRVRLELHLVVAVCMLLMSMLLIIVDDFKEGFSLPQLMDIDASMTWFQGHVNALTFQTAWDLLFLSQPVLHAINTAATMNRLIEAHLQKVSHLADIVGEADAGDCSPGRAGSQSEYGSPSSEVGVPVRSIIRFAKAELASGGSSATRFLSIVKIDRQTFAIAGTILSVFTGGQFVEIFENLLGATEG